MTCQRHSLSRPSGVVVLAPVLLMLAAPPALADGWSPPPRRPDFSLRDQGGPPVWGFFQQGGGAALAGYRNGWVLPIHGIGGGVLVLGVDHHPPRAPSLVPMVSVRGALWHHGVYPGALVDAVAGVGFLTDEGVVMLGGGPAVILPWIWAGAGGGVVSFGGAGVVQERGLIGFELRLFATPAGTVVMGSLLVAERPSRLGTDQIF